MLLLKSVILLSVLPLQLFCQSNSSQSRLLPPGTIDGSKTPSLIPDATAYRVVFLALAEPPNPTAVQLARQQRKLKAISTTSEDAVLFAATLQDFAYQYAALRASLRTDPSTQRQTFISAREILVNNTMSRLFSQLTPATMSHFQTFVQQAKTRITIAPAPKR